MKPSTSTRSSRPRTTCSRMARPVDWSSTTITVLRAEGNTLTCAFTMSLPGLDSKTKLREKPTPPLLPCPASGGGFMQCLTLGMRLDVAGEVVVQRGPVDAPRAGTGDDVDHRIAVRAEIGERHQAVPGLDLRRVSGLAALDRADTARERPVHRGVPQPEVKQPFARAVVVEADELVDDARSHVEAEHEGDHVAGGALAQDDEIRLRARRDDLEEPAVEPLQAGRRLLVGLPEQAEQGVEVAGVRVLQHLDAQVDPLRAAPDLLAQHMPAAALQRGKVALLAGRLQVDAGAGEALHPEQPALLRDPFDIRGIGRRNILPHQHRRPPPPRLAPKPRRHRDRAPPPAAARLRPPLPFFAAGRAHDRRARTA